MIFTTEPQRAQRIIIRVICEIRVQEQVLCKQSGVTFMKKNEHELRIYYDCDNNRCFFFLMFAITIVTCLVV